MGKFLLLSAAIAVGYLVGYRDARAHPDHILGRAVQQTREMFGGRDVNNVDAAMTKVEGKN